MSSRIPFVPRRFPLTVIATCFLAMACGPTGPADPDRPIVVLVTLDTTRADYLGCYGADAPGISPRIDQLANEGVVFTQAISQAAVTPVSHASIMTGLWPYNHGLRVMHGNYQSTLRDGEVTLAEVLRDRGYDTGAFVSALPVTEYFGFDQGFDHFDANFASQQAMASGVQENGTVNTGGHQRRAEDTTDAALAWMDSRENPFFIWLHYFDVHDEHMVPPQDEFIGVEFSTDDQTRRRELYRLELTYMDRELGRVFDKLESMNLWDDSVVVVTSDHGEGLGDHDWWTHGILYQEQVRVPLIVKAPGMLAGSRVDSTVRCLDIVPTVGALLGLAGGDMPKVDGVSLVPLMNGTSKNLGLVAYADSVNIMTYNTSPELIDVKDEMLFSLVLENRWKYIHHFKRPKQSELYDLVEDPAELTNLFRRKPAIAKRAHDALKAVKFVPKKQLEVIGTPKHILEGLSGLGYTAVEEETDPAEEDGQE